jgi:predicted house-cleaning noncanonical NTP pyrophosphatase (MazG superfamily)
MDRDALARMWDQQEAYMHLLVEQRNFPPFPLDLSVKANQKFIKGIVHECQDELFEAVKELKNCKAHRQTEVKEFDREKYLEELVDAQHYLVEAAILSGFTKEEFLLAYLDKGAVNVDRIKRGY